MQSHAAPESQPHHGGSCLPQLPPCAELPRPSVAFCGLWSQLEEGLQLRRWGKPRTLLTEGLPEHLRAKPRLQMMGRSLA